MKSIDFVKKYPFSREEIDNGIELKDLPLKDQEMYAALHIRDNPIALLNRLGAAPLVANVASYLSQSEENRDATYILETLSSVAREASANKFKSEFKATHPRHQSIDEHGIASAGGSGIANVDGVVALDPAVALDVARVHASDNDITAYARELVDAYRSAPRTRTFVRDPNIPWRPFVSEVTGAAASYFTSRIDVVGPGDGVEIVDRPF